LSAALLAHLSLYIYQIGAPPNREVPLRLVSQRAFDLQHRDFYIVSFQH